ncbi:hypothetical protein ANCDUO_04923 [Ancylostoma duodenale]|uniref:RRM domain-containing protein n=1 Tax=Ancylostoma duodenale TaxID=51022 RepID=A0A0C2H5Q2_9BILA|nr:hypothetical protein ANCDUO_04923 [Ancylostoma duodenale]
MDAQDSKINQNTDETVKENGHSNKGNEDKKIFVGGIAYDVINEDLTNHFQQFGEVAQAQVKFDRVTGRSRGFAFVEFATGEGCKAALAAREQTIKNKQVEVKPAKSRENKKVFVGGLPSDYNEGELRSHFEQFGKVEDIEWPFDKQTKMRRNFAFIVFEEEEAADKASAQAKQTFGNRECDVKKAVPQGKRFAAMGGRGNGMRPYGGRGGVNGGAAWYGAWGQMGMPYGAGAAWGDWYGAANSFYGQQNGSAAYGNAYGAGGAGYDSYQQGGARQNGNASGQRYQQAAQQQQY